MTADSVIKWLKHFGRQMILAGRKVILLCDNTASHNQGHLYLHSIKLHFLPPNTMSHIQPMDAGIIKTYYRKQLVQDYTECAQSGQPQSVNFRQALSMIQRALDSVYPANISNCLRHVEKLPQPQENQNNLEDMPLLDLTTSESADVRGRNLCRRLHCPR